MIPVVVFDRDPRVARIVSDMLAGVESVAEAGVAGTWSEVITALDSNRHAAVILGPGSLDEDLEEVLATKRTYPSAAFVRLVESVDSATLQRAMRFGVHDVVATQDGELELAEAVRRAHEMTSNGAPPPPSNGSARQSRVATVFGAKGGTGKTTVATNLAVISARAGIKTVLVDARPEFGDCAAFLRIRPDRSLAELHGIGGLDESMLAGVTTTHESGLSVLCAPVDRDESRRVDGQLLAAAIKALRTTYDLVVIDTAPGLDELAASALGETDIAYLVTSLDLPSIKDATLALSILGGLHVPGEKIRVVLNRADSKVDFPPEEVAKAMGRKIAASLPSDIAVPRSINAGVPVAVDRPRSPIAKGLEKLAHSLHKEIGKAGASASQSSNGARPKLMRRLAR